MPASTCKQESSMVSVGTVTRSPLLHLQAVDIGSGSEPAMAAMAATMKYEVSEEEEDVEKI